MEDSKIDPATIAAFSTTHYVVLAPDPFVLRVGEVSAPLADLLAREKASCAAYVTAWNPFCKIVTDEDNRAAQRALMANLEDLGLTTLPGLGKDPTGVWPGEESILVMGLPLDEARRLGVQYKQNAIVWVGSNACPQVVLLR